MRIVTSTGPASIDRSEDSPMRRGLKFLSRHPLQQRTHRSEDSPMRRGLK